MEAELETIREGGLIRVRNTESQTSLRESEAEDEFQGGFDKGVPPVSPPTPPQRIVFQEFSRKCGAVSVAQITETLLVGK